MYQIKRSDEEIDAAVNWAFDAEESGSRYPGMSYENGVQAALDWVVGNTDDRPDPEK